MLKRKLPQEEIFGSFGWWDKGCFLYQMTGDRCDYIESGLIRVFGKGSLALWWRLDLRTALAPWGNNGGNRPFPRRISHCA